MEPLAALHRVSRLVVDELRETMRLSISRRVCVLDIAGNFVARWL
jgi:hypothetical protein